MFFFSLQLLGIEVMLTQVGFSLVNVLSNFFLRQFSVFLLFFLLCNMISFALLYWICSCGLKTRTLVISSSDDLCCVHARVPHSTADVRLGRMSYCVLHIKYCFCFSLSIVCISPIHDSMDELPSVFFFFS